MSSVGRPELFLDRSLGRITATRLRDAGDVVHLIADHYPDDASDVPGPQDVDRPGAERSNSLSWLGEAYLLAGRHGDAKHLATRALAVTRAQRGPSLICR